jgi:hypothetical protein
MMREGGASGMGGGMAGAAAGWMPMLVGMLASRLCCSTRSKHHQAGLPSSCTLPLHVLNGKHGSVSADEQVGIAHARSLLLEAQVF